MNWKCGFLTSAAFTALVTAACTSARSATRREACALTKRDSMYLVNGPVYRACQVDKPAMVANAVTDLRFKATPGRTTCFSAEIEFVVDTLGSPEIRTVHVVRASDPDFADAIIASIRDWRYEPAQLGGHTVRQIATTMHRASPATGQSASPVPVGGSGRGAGPNC